MPRSRTVSKQRSTPQRLMGVETEYAVAAVAARATRGKELAGVLVQTALAERPSIGCFLGNGARLYVDTGDHPEFATPECTDPREVVRYIRAGDRILSTAAGHPHVRGRFGRPLLLRCNVDYAGNTWGCHESYLYRAADVISENLARHLIPHLVSRTVITGAGGFDPRSEGLRFTLSPRSAFIVRAVSESTTSGRGIFNTRHEALGDSRYGRLHVICGDTLCSDRAAWLKLGSTGLIVALIEAGDAPGRNVQLGEPVSMLQTVAADAACRLRLRLTDGRFASALDIQREYLSWCERRLGHPMMPDWAEAVCRAWRATLDMLAENPHEAATSLDWAIKRRIYARRAERHAIPSTSWPLWTTMVDTLRVALRRAGAGAIPITADEILGRASPVRQVVRDLTPRLRNAGFHWDQLDAFLRLRQEMFEIDRRFGQLGGDGIFDRLDALGLIDHRVDGVGDVALAVDRPPPVGRARLRGQFVREHAGDTDFSVSWEKVVDERGGRLLLDLSDPFAARAAGTEEEVRQDACP